jgi:hypothetical protein
MRTIRHTTTLFYYDGPQVFEARDTIGGHYIAVAVESDTVSDRYLVAGVSPESLRRFRSGTLDLRSLLVEGSELEWYLARAEAGLDQPLSLEAQTTSLAISNLLPEPGFLLHDHPAGILALDEARQRNNLVITITFDPPEAANEHRIHVETLVGLLVRVQTMVSYAYSGVTQEPLPNTRRIANRSGANLLDVVGLAAEGHTQVVLEAAKPSSNLVGENELGRALERVDLLFENASNPEQTLAAVIAHPGHLARAYFRLLRFLVKHKTGLGYSWAEPGFSKPNSRVITHREVGALVELLSNLPNLGAE